MLQIMFRIPPGEPPPSPPPVQDPPGPPENTEIPIREPQPDEPDDILIFAPRDGAKGEETCDSKTEVG